MGLLAGALLLSHFISTPEPVTLVEPAAPPVPTVAPVAPAPKVVERAAPPTPTGMQLPEFDAADAVLANPNASNDSVRDALGLFQRCVQYEPANTRCVKSLQQAQTRVAALPPDPAPPQLVADDQKFRAVGETLNRKRDLTRLRTMPTLKTNPLPERMKLKLEEK